MIDRDAKDLLAEADQRNLRRALVVTALGLELDAVRAHLSELCSVQGRDGQIYECGVFLAEGQNWLVVIVETGAGTHPALGAVQNAHFLMGEFEVQLLIGVGGSRKEDDAPLGSVVAASHVYMPYGGKATDAGHQSRPREFPVDSRLLGLATKIRRDKDWPNRILPPYRGALPEPYPFEMPPVGHVAPIASIEAVLAGRKSELELMLSRQFNDTCVVEMEGYGAVYAATTERTPSIVIRGVSDLAKEKDPVSDRNRQPVAACHAAAFGFEMLAKWGLRYLPPQKIAPAAPAPQAAPSRASSPDQEQGAAACSAEDTVNPTPDSPQTSRIVLNIDIPFAEATPERIRELEAAIRRVMKADTLVVTGAEEGSVRLVISDPTGALVKTSLTVLREQLQAAAGVELLGRVEEAEYRQLEAVHLALDKASRELMAWPTTLTTGEWIERPELAGLLQTVQTETTSTTALLGAPGSGKSALLATLCQTIARDLKWPLLAIKADLLPTEITTEDQLASHLGLPDRPSEMLERLSKLRPVMLVIDQLDALAAHLDLRTGRLNVLLNLVRRLGELDNVHIVLSSRTFEFQHDVRLKTIRAQDLSLTLPAWPEVSAILEAHGVQADGWPDDAQEVMRSPQALTIYLGLKRSAKGEFFATYQAMLERLWKERVTSGEDGQRRSTLVSRLADGMAEEESLWLPRVRFEDYEPEIVALESAGILVPAGGEGSLGFSHQTLFDHALARSFARGAGRLSRYVLDRQTSLFLRPKLWAALTYLRGVDPAAYATEIEAIWTAQGLRTHLRLLLIDFIGQQATPTDREVLLLDRALAQSATRAVAFKAISGSPGWFDRLASGRIADAMTSDPDLVRAVLLAAAAFAPERVVDLVKARWISDAAKDANTWMVLQNLSTWSSKTLELAQAILARTEVSAFNVDYVVGTLGVDQPELALELVRSQLDAELARAIVEAEKRAANRPSRFGSLDEEVQWRIQNSARDPIRRLIDRNHDWDSVGALAETNPSHFMETIWPWYLKVLDALRDRSEQREGFLGYALGTEADYRFDDEPGMDLTEPSLLAAIRIAAQTLANEHPVEFEQWLWAQQDVDALPVHRLMAHVLSLAPEARSALAFTYLMDDQRRWFLGSIHGHTSTTTKLIKRCSERWSDEQVEQAETAMSAYDPPPPPSYTGAKQRRGWKRTVRQLRHRLLSSLPRERLSEVTRRKLVEEARVFPRSEVDADVTGISSVGARMSAGAMSKATDPAILHAFEVLPDQTDWHHPNDWMAGGNIQLSREFANFAKDNVARAVSLMDRFTPEIGTRAAGYALDALAEQGPADLVQTTLVSLASRGFDGEEFRTSCASAIERLARRKASIDQNVIAVLEGWIEMPLAPPVQDDAAGEEGSDNERLETQEDEEDIASKSALWGLGGLSVVPGGDYPILSALIHVRIARNEPEALVSTLDAVLSRSTDLRLWENVLLLSPYFQRGAAEADLRPAFLRRLFAKFPALLVTQAGVRALAYAQWWSPELLREQLHRDVWNGSKSSQRAFGELIGLVRISQPSQQWTHPIVATLLTDAAQVEARAGVALSAVNLWPEPKDRTLATDLLVELAKHNEPGVWTAIFELFRIVEELTPEADTVRLLTAIADHIWSAPKVSAVFVVERLQSLLPYEALLVGRIALGLTSVWGDDLGDVRTSYALVAAELVDLAVTLHRLGPETRELGTSLFEELMQIDAYSARDTLDQIDSRFRSARSPVRARLQRRRARARRRRAE